MNDSAGRCGRGDGAGWRYLGSEYEGVAASRCQPSSWAGQGRPLTFPELTTDPIYQHLGSAKKSRGVFESGITSSSSSIGEISHGRATYRSSLGRDPVWDMARAHDITNHLVTAFLLSELQDDAEASTALRPENVRFPGIRYETTAFAAAPR